MIMLAIAETTALMAAPIAEKIAPWTLQNGSALFAARLYREEYHGYCREKVREWVWEGERYE